MRLLTILAVLVAASPAAANPFRVQTAANPFVVEPAPAPPALTVAQAEDECRRTGKPLFVWLNYACKSTEVRVPEGIHVHTEEPQHWPDGVVKQPSVIVVTSRPDLGAGRLRRVAVVAPEDVCANNLRKPVEEDKVARGKPVLRLNAAPAWQPAPTFAAPPSGGRAWGSRG